jgi:hypothetical protein
MNYSVQDFLQVLAGDSNRVQARADEQSGALAPGSVVRFSRYFDPHLGDFASSDIAGGMMGTLEKPDENRNDHYIVRLGDTTPVSVHKQNLSTVKI